MLLAQGMREGPPVDVMLKTCRDWGLATSSTQWGLVTVYSVQACSYAARHLPDRHGYMSSAEVLA